MHAPQSVEVTIWRLESDSIEINWSFAFIPGEILLVLSGLSREFVGPGANLECGALVYKYFDGGLGA